MLDERYQGKGYGREAMGLILDFIRSGPCRKANYAWISYNPKNTVAKNMYASFGFEEVPEASDPEEDISSGCRSERHFPVLPVGFSRQGKQPDKSTFRRKTIMEKKTTIENLARAACEKGSFNGAWLYAENGEIVSKGAFGFRDAERRISSR